MKCKAHLKSGQPCKLPAVKGQTVCHKHGAGGNALQKTVEANTRHGRYSRYAVPVALADYERLAADPNHLDLSDEIALARSVLQEVLKGVDVTPETLPKLKGEGEVAHKARMAFVRESRMANALEVVGEVSKVVEKESKRRGTVTANQLVVFLARVADVVRTGIDRNVSNADERANAWRDIRFGLSGLTGGPATGDAA